MHWFERIVGATYSSHSNELVGILGRATEEFEEDLGWRHVIFANSGVQLRVVDEVVTVAFMDLGGSSKALFTGALPFGLDRAMDRNAVRTRFGPPVRSKDGVHVPILGSQTWDSFAVPGGEFQVSFDRELRMSRLALSQR